jgi:hypothetical protein
MDMTHTQTRMDTNMHYTWHTQDEITGYKPYSTFVHCDLGECTFERGERRQPQQPGGGGGWFRQQALVVTFHFNVKTECISLFVLELIFIYKGINSEMSSIISVYYNVF